MIGARVGNYRVDRKLGDGGMGSVFLAYDEMLDREVALKVLRPELAQQAALMDRFRQEAIALARLNHPRIASLHGLERHDDNLVMVMEYVRGSTLEHTVQQFGRIGWTRAAEMCSDILDALDHAHDKGVIHRDIKPANAMLGPDGRVKVMDFGIARLRDRDRQTRAGHAVGTPTYMSPEQLRGEEVDGRSDLYAVGAVLFELITGRIAFEADSDYELMMKQLNEMPPPPSRLVSDVPPSIDAVVLTAMAKQRESRYRDATVMRNALQEALAQHGSATSARPAPVAPPTRLVSDIPVAMNETGELRSDVPPATRLADAAHVPATRLAPPPSELEPVYDAKIPGARGLDAEHTLHWSRDWRVFTTAGLLLSAVALLMLTRQSPRSEITSDSSAAVLSADSSGAPSAGTDVAVGPLAGAAGTTSGPQPSNAPVVPPDARPLRPEDQVAPSPSAPSAPPTPSGARTPPTGKAAGSRTPRGARAADPTPQPVAPSTAGSTDPGPPPRPAAEREPVREAPAEDAAALRAQVRTAINNFADAVNDRRTGSVQGVLRGSSDVVDTWLSLMGEGRLQMAVQDVSGIDINGSRATAQLTASINVRSAFGANKRRAASFATELARGGSGWRVVAMRPTGQLNLK
jgi:serine/threonine-protein kinase